MVKNNKYVSKKYMTHQVAFFIQNSPYYDQRLNMSQTFESKCKYN